MANWSDTTIRIYGTEEQIKEAEKIIEKYTDKQWLGFENEDEVYKEFGEFKEELDKLDPVSFRAGFSYMEIFNMEVEKNSIYISGSGRWCSPYLFFELLAKKLKLDLEYFDAEAGCDFSYLLIMENGKAIKRKDMSYYSRETIEYLYDDFDEFLESIEWYFEEEQEEIEEIENLFKEFGTSRKEIMQNAA